MPEFDVFKKASEGLRADPPRSAWKRIESRLDAHTARRSLLHSRMIGYAAAIVLLVGGCASILYLSMQPQFQQSSAYSQSIVDMQISDLQEESIYDPEKVKDLAARMGQLD